MSIEPNSPRRRPARQGRRRRLRSLFVSDLHLGSRGARAREFLRFLRETECETIYLVGDIFDIWHVGLVSWSPAHDAVLTELASRAAEGARLVYLPGNHDAAMRNFIGIGEKLLRVGAFELQDRVTHKAADGRRYLVLHGDQCDARWLKWHFLTRLGSRMEAGLRRCDQSLSTLMGDEAPRARLDHLRRGVNALALWRNDFEGRLVRLARETGHDGVICGHFHQAALRDHGGIAYANCGDWVDSLTALAETHDGALHLLEWEAAAHVLRPSAAAEQSEECAA